MTMNYNVTFEGVKEQISDHMKKRWCEEGNEYFFEVPPKFSKSGAAFELSSKDFISFVSILYKTLHRQPSVHNITTYLNGMAELMLKVNKKITWITPAGMVVNSTYQTFSSKKTKAFLFGSSKPITLSIPSGKVDHTKSKRAMLANMVHSLDGSNIHLLVDLMQKKNKLFPIYTIHDCFATTPNNMKDLEMLVKEAFILIYFGTKGYLTKMHEHIIGDLRSNYEVNELRDDEGTLVTDKDGQTISTVKVKNEVLQIPNIPKSRLSNDIDIFKAGIRNSDYFLS